MKKHTIESNPIPAVTIGLDLSDRSFQFCELDQSGVIIAEGNRPLTRAKLVSYLSAKPLGARVALETGGQSAWVSEVIELLGHEAVVANARDLKAVTGRSHRSDRRDAQQLAKLARVDVSLLNPVQLRSTIRQADLFIIRARAALVEARTKLINFARGATKMMGHRLPASVSYRFAERAIESVPEILEAALVPVLEVLRAIGERIAAYDELIEKLADERYPETRWLKQVPGVGTLTALAFVLTVGEPDRFARSRDAGVFVGLAPRRKQSGEEDPELRITKCGDRYLRRLLVQCAHVLMGRFGQDCALRQWAIEHSGNSKSKKKRTVVAVARKLAVLLHRLWNRQEAFRPFPQAA